MGRMLEARRVSKGAPNSILPRLRVGLPASPFARAAKYAMFVSCNAGSFGRYSLRKSSMRKGTMSMKRNIGLAMILPAILLVATVAGADQAKVTTVAAAKVVSCPPAAVPTCTVYQPCVSYAHCGRCCCNSSPTVKQTLMVNDPCDCCCVAQIPVCLPACCKDACVSSKCGRFGRRGIVTYSYDCGVCVTIKFRPCGDVVVIYSGC
jgi:hypothetical protein